METTAIIEKIQAIFPDVAVTQGRQWPEAKLPVHQWLDTASWLRTEKAFHFDFLFCLTCIDWLKHLTMVYHLASTLHRHALVVKVDLDRHQPSVHTVSHIWRTAEFHEREVFEMFGVQFINHPDLRKLILPDDWEGFPMRKDYEDPINMIKL